MDDKAHEIMQALKARGIRVKYDNDDTSRPGWKFAEYEMKGVPVRVAIGARDLENGVVEIARRDTKEKQSVSMDGVDTYIAELLDTIQQNIYQKALAFREAHITPVNTWDEFVKTLDEKTGFVSAHWDGTPETEEAIKQQTKATIRCIPLDAPEEAGTCILTGKPSNKRVLFARAY